MISAAPIQPATQPARRGLPMWTISGLRSRLDKTEQQIFSLIENGDLLWVFDLSLVPERATRRVLRIVPQCVEDYAAGRKCLLEWQDVKRLIVPHDRPVLSSFEIRRSCNCTRTHIHAMVRRKLLEVVPDPCRASNAGVGAATASFLELMETRRFS